LTVSLNNFTYDVYKQLKPDNENLFFSPLSIDLALLMAYEGAKADTRTEFEKVLHLNMPDQNYNDVYFDFITNLTRFIDKSNQLSISHALWIRDGFKIVHNYQDIIQNKYAADVLSIDFSDRDNSSLKINNWVSERTENLIKEIITPGDINNLTNLIISDVVCFIGNWENKFDKSNTKQDNFYSIERNIVSSAFMNKTEYLDYYENIDFQFISKPYIGHDKTFCVILPIHKYGINRIEDKFDKSLLDTIFQNITKVEVQLSLPKFKFETGYNLSKPLIKLGMQSTFGQNADFSGITRDTALILSMVSHRAYIKVDEEKTEAAAASTAVSPTSSVERNEFVPRIFKADHPFIFMVLDNKTKAIIFMGRFVKPEL